MRYTSVIEVETNVADLVSEIKEYQIENWREYLKDNFKTYKKIRNDKAMTFVVTISDSLLITVVCSTK